jgi:hypothetical protein
MMNGRVLVLAIVLLLGALGPATLPAQLSGVQPGTRVRVSLREQFRQADGPEHRRLEISRGVSRPASMVERAVGGAIASAVTFALMNDPKRTGGPAYRTDWRAAGVGAAWGGGIGAALGLLFPHESWRRVRL